MNLPKLTRWLLVAVLPWSTAAHAFEFEILDGEVGVRINNLLSTGVQVRMQSRNHELIGGLNLNPDLCSEQNCLFEENADLVAAPGAFSGVNGDDGNLNYDKGDITAAVTKLNSDLTVSWRNWLVRIHAIGFFDPVNVGFEESHPDTRYQPAKTPRPDSIEDIYGKDVLLYEAYVQRSFDWFGQAAALTIGNQLVRWGESTLVALNSLSEINPPNAALFRMPGVELNEIFQPVPLVLLSTDIIPDVSADIFYQFGWKKVQPEPRGSFMSDTDLVGGTNAYITLGQFGENPDRMPVLVEGNDLSLISSTTVTTYLLPEESPRDLGQYGVRLNYFAEWLNDGTDLSLYAMNYHSRLPYGRYFATNASCARDSTDAASATAACQGFNGSANPNASGDPGNTAQEPLPIQTMNAGLVYPEDIRMFGASFNTNIGSWSLAGEYSFRPNLPLQIHVPDLTFMALNPAFPVSDIPIGGIGTLPAAQNAIPSYLLEYRGFSYDDPDNRVQPNQEIPGYERFAVEQVDFTAIKALSNNWFQAEQLLIILEAGATHIRGLPAPTVLPIETGYLNNTHPSAGADGTGTVDGEPDVRRLNPTQQTEGFATKLSWGVRGITRAEYNDVIYGFNFLPTVIFAHDVSGTAPFPMQNFVEGRTEITAGTEVQFSQNFAGRVLYQWFFGAGDRNTRSDRDNVALSFSYAF